MHRLIPLFFSLIFLLCGNVVQAATGNAASGPGKRIALVIGNAAYPQPLLNPVNDARAMAGMFEALATMPKPVVGVGEGAAGGGGTGLAAVCDVVIAADDALFGFTETKLGILPAVISPYAIAKIGVSQARALFLTAERFTAQRARDIGLVHHVVPAAVLDQQLGVVVQELSSSAPAAMARSAASAPPPASRTSAGSSPR